VFAAIAALAWAVASVPFVTGLGALVGGARSALALAAMLLSSGGVLLLGFATFAFVGADLAILAAFGVRGLATGVVLLRRPGAARSTTSQEP